MTQAPRTPSGHDACHACGAALAADQRHCIACGARRAGRRDDVLALLLANAAAERAAAAAAAAPAARASSLDAARRRRAALPVALATLVGLAIVSGSGAPSTLAGSGQPPFTVVLPAQQQLAATSPPATPIVPEPAALEPAPSFDQPLVDDVPLALTEPQTPPAVEDSLVAGEPAAAPESDPAPDEPAAEAPPEGSPIRHVSLVVLPSSDVAALAADSAVAPYLAGTLAPKGALLSEYGAVSRGGLANAIALVSGQGPTPRTLADCQPAPPAATTPPADPTATTPADAPAATPTDSAAATPTNQAATTPTDPAATTPADLPAATPTDPAAITPTVPAASPPATTPSVPAAAPPSAPSATTPAVPPATTPSAPGATTPAVPPAATPTPPSDAAGTASPDGRADVAPADALANGQTGGDGCVYGLETGTLGDQLRALERTWKAYVEPAADAPAARSCETGPATTRRNPFLWFRSAVEAEDCDARTADLTRLASDLADADTTPALSYVASDAIAAPADADAFLARVVPQILASPAYADGGLLVVTSDQAPPPAATPAPPAATAPTAPTTAAPHVVAAPGPRAYANVGDAPAAGAGQRVGALLVSRFTPRGVVDRTPASHFSLLRTLSEIFGVDPLGYAAARSVRALPARLIDATTR